MSTSATRKTAILSMKQKYPVTSSNMFEKILKLVPKLEEQNFKNKMNREGFVQLNGNIWYHIPISKTGKNVNTFYIKNQGYKYIKNVNQNVLNNLKFAVGVHYNNITKAEKDGRVASAKFLKNQLKNMVNELRGKNIFRLSTAATSVKRKRK